MTCLDNSVTNQAASATRRSKVSPVPPAIGFSDQAGSELDRFAELPARTEKKIKRKRKQSIE
ncbi:MAG: hypothetical protein HPY50_20400 [Firmicutes bacterium]|nr:hypothetical protein [Bacillota bacterium]